MPEIKQDLRTATMIVAANDSLHRNMANYVCDGVADEVEINAAMAALPAQGGRVILLEGTFVLAHPIDFPADDIILEGQGTSTFIDGDALPTTEHAIQISGRTGCTVKNLKVQTEDGGGKTCHCIFIEDGSNDFILENIIIADSDSDGIHIEGTTISEGHIHNCDVDDADDHGIFIDMDAANFALRFHISDCVIVGTGLGGIEFGTTGAGYNYCEVTNNIIFQAGEHGLQAWEFDYSHITNNVILSSGQSAANGHGIQVIDSVHVIIESNTCFDNLYHGIRIENSDECQLIGNDCCSNDSGGTDTYDGINIDGSSDQCNITGNHCCDNDRYGILIGGSTNTVGENYCAGNGQTGIHAVGTFTKITGNYLYENGYHGIYVGALRAQVVGNHCFDNSQHAAATYHGIDLGADADQCQVNDNFCDSPGDSQEDGIHLEDGATECQINNNNCFNGMGSGIALTANNDDCQIVGNYCQDNDDYGIEIVAATCNDTFVDGNHLQGNVTGQLLDSGTATHYGFNSVAAEANVARVGQALGAQGVNFATVQAAINFAATQAPSATNPWTVEIYPGIYDEAITCSSWVNLKGIGPRSSVIISQDNGTTVISTVAGNVNHIQNLTLRLVAPDAARFIFRTVDTATITLTDVEFLITTPGNFSHNVCRLSAGAYILERCKYSIVGGAGITVGIFTDATPTIRLIDNDFHIATSLSAYHIYSSAAATFIGKGNRYSGTCNMFVVSAGTFTFDSEAMLCTGVAGTNTGTTMTLRNCAIEAPVVAGNTALVRLKDCSYRAIQRAGTGNIVDESPWLSDAPWKVHKWNWMVALPSADVGVRGTPTDAGSGQVLLEVNTGAAADQEAVETNPEVAGSLGNEFTPARTPRFITQIAVDNFHADADMFFGLRETLGNAIPNIAAEECAGFDWNGANFRAISSDGAGVGVFTNLTTPTVNTHVQLEVIVIGGVRVEFYVNGVLVATHATAAGRPSAVLDWQHLLNNGAGGGAAADIDVTVRSGGVQECPS